MPQTRLRIRVQPGARRTEIVGFQNERLRLRVTAPPERGRANEAAIELLAKTLDVPKSRFRLTRGATSRDKVVLIEGIGDAEARRRLAAVQQDSGDDLQHDDGDQRR